MEERVIHVFDEDRVAWVMIPTAQYNKMAKIIDAYFTTNREVLEDPECAEIEELLRTMGNKEE